MAIYVYQSFRSTRSYLVVFTGVERVIFESESWKTVENKKYTLIFCFNLNLKCVI